MKRDTNDCFSITAFSYNNNGENYSPRDARSVELANFHWKLVQRYEVFPKVPNILEEKSSFLRYFQTFRFANASWLKDCNARKSDLFL